MVNCMVKFKKILIISILLIIVGLTISAVSARTHTTSVMRFKNHDTVNKYIGKGDYIGISYESGYSGQNRKSNIFSIVGWSKDFDLKFHKVTKANIKFTKKINGKYKIKDKTMKNLSSPITLTKGWKPYSTIVTYKDT